MTDYPIMFSAPMILRLLAEAAEQGTGKSMTRRLAWGKWLTAEQAAKHTGPLRIRGDAERAPAYAQAASPWQRVEIGDRLWVRENFWRFGRWAGKRLGGGKIRHSFKPFPNGSDELRFVADGKPPFPPLIGRFGQSDPAWHLRPNIFLERKHSRLTLTVTAKKIERLQAISENDCECEGVQYFGDRDYGIGSANDAIRATDYIGCFSALWWKLHGIGAWNQNPEVVALTFRVELRNIDADQPVGEFAGEIEHFLHGRTGWFVPDDEWVLSSDGD